MTTPEIDYSKYSEAELFAMLKGQKPVTAAPAQIPDYLKPEEPTPMVRIGQGMNDVYTGIKQKYLNFTNPEEATKYTKEQNESNALLEKGREAHGQTGFDPYRMLGTMATPLSFVPMGAGGLLARAGLGMAAGGAGGYANFDPVNTKESNLINTGVGAVGGGVLSAAAPPVLGAIIKGGQAVGNAAGNLWRSLAQQISPNLVSNINNKVQVTLQNNGIDFSKLPDAVKASVMDDAAKQFSATGKLDPEMLLRKADIEAIGGAGTATKAQVTRDPSDWTTAQNLQKTEVNIPAVMRGEQETMTGRFQQQNTNTNKYAKALQDQMTATVDPWFANAPKAATPLQASEQTIKAIQQKDLLAKKAVDDLYTKFRDMGKGDVAVPDTQIAQTLGKIADEIGVENIPPAVLSRLKQFGFMDGQRTKLLTVTEADKLGRLIGNNNPGHGTVSLASSQLKKAVDNAILEIPEIDASKALMAARDLARSRFKDQEAGVAVEKAIADVAPDRFFQQNIIGGNVRDINALKDQLIKTADGGQAWNSLREHTMKFINDNATNTNGVFSGKGMQDAMDRIGEDKLKAIFSPAELAKIKTLGRGSYAMTVEPPFSAPNRSNTTPSLIGQALRITNRIPGVNLLSGPISQEVESSIQQKLLASALESGGASAGQDAAQTAKRLALMKILMTNRPINPSMIPTAAQEQYKPAQ